MVIGDFKSIEQFYKVQDILFKLGYKYNDENKKQLIFVTNLQNTYIRVYNSRIIYSQNVNLEMTISAQDFINTYFKKTKLLLI